MTRTLPAIASTLARAAAPPLLLVLVGFSLFPSSGQDDTHITCWPAYTLSQFGQILNYNGDRIEQSSSLLQVLVLAFLHRITGADLLTLAKLSSIASGVAVVMMISTLVGRVTNRTAALSAAIITAAAPPLVYWSFSGMEASLVASTGVWLILTTADYMAGHPSGSLRKAVLAMTAFALVRPETPLLLGCMLAAGAAVALVAERVPDQQVGTRNELRRRAVRLLTISAIVCLAPFAFRLSYFGDLFPQPVSAKFSRLSVRNAVTGLQYVKGHAWNYSPAAAAVTLSLLVSASIVVARQVRASPPNSYVVLSLLFTTGYLSFVILSGGDWMAGGRFLVHFLPVATAFVAFALGGCNSRAVWLLAGLLVTLELSWAVTLARNSSTSVPLWSWTSAGHEYESQYSWFERRSRINRRDMPLIENLDRLIASMSTNRKTPIVIISGQMGMVAYYTAMRHFGRLRFVDRHGLVERTLTACVTTRDVPKDTGGLILSFTRYFAALTAMKERCDLTRPDVVFDIGSFDNAGVGQYGYRAVYEQTGAIAAAGTRLAGVMVRADAFIAVDRRLLPSTEGQAVRHHFGR